MAKRTQEELLQRSQVEAALTQTIRDMVAGKLSQGHRERVPAKTGADQQKFSMQKQREDQQWEGVSLPGAEKIRKDTAAKVKSPLQLQQEKAQKEYDSYIETDDYRRRVLDGLAEGSRSAAEEDQQEKELRIKRDYWNQQIKRQEEQKRQESDLKVIEAMTSEEKEALEEYIRNRESAFAQSLNPAMTGLPASYEDNPLIQKYGRTRLDQLVRSYQRSRNREEYEAAQQLGADQGKAAAVGASAASVGANLADTFLNPLERISQMWTGAADRFETIDPYAGGKAGAYASGVRQQVAQDIEGEDPTLLRKALSYLYQGGMSALDSGARALIGGSPTVAAGLSALGSFNQTLASASAQGATPEQAVALAAVNAGIEALAEKLPMDELFKIAGGRAGRHAIANILKQAGIEAAEEEVSLIATTLAEAAILREKSGYQQTIQEAMAVGATYEEAKTIADQELLQEAGETAIVSGFAGGLSAGGAERIASKFGKPDQSRQMATGSQEQKQEVRRQEEAAQPVQKPQEPDRTAWQETNRRTQETRQETRQEAQKPAEQRTAQQEPAKQNHQDEIPEFSQEDLSSISGEPRQEADPITAMAQEYAAMVPKQEPEAIPEGLRHFDNAAAEAAGVRQDVRQEPEKTPEPEQAQDRRGPGSDREVEKMGFKYNFVLPDNSYFLPGSNGSYTLYDDGTVASDAIYDVLNNLEAWKNKGIFHMYDVTVDGKPVKQTDDFPSGLYMVAGVDKRPVLRELAGSYVLAEKGRIVMSKDGKMPKKSGNAQKTQESQTQRQTAPKAQETVSAPMVDTQKVSPEEGRIKGTGAAERNFTGKASYQDLLYEGNVQPDRPGDVRPMEVPETDHSGRHVTGTAGNIYGAQVTTDPLANKLEELINNGAMGYDRVSNAAMVEQARTAIYGAEGRQGMGRQEALRRIHEAVRSGKWNAEVQAQSMVLFADYASQGEKGMDEATSLMADIAQMGHEAGFQLQLMKMLRSLTPEGQLMATEKGIQRTVEKMQKTGQVKKGQTVTFDPKLEQEFLEAERALKDLESQESESGQHREAAQEKLQEVQSRIEEARKRLEDSKAKATEAKSLVQKAEEEAKAAERQADRAERSAGKAKETLEATRQKTAERVKDAQTRAKAAEERIRAAEEEIRQLKEEARRLEKEAKKVENRGKTREKQLEDARKRRDQAEAALQLQVASSMKATFKAKWDAWRYMSMLFNAKTQVRNVVGNAAFRPYVEVKNLAGAAMEKLLLDKSRRTKAILGPGRGDRELLEWARTDRKTTQIQDALEYSGQLGDDVSTQKMRKQMQVFQSKTLEAVRKLSSEIPGKADMLFKQSYYERSLAGFLKARGYTAADLNAGTVPPNVLDEGRSYAISEAMRGTFNDANELSDFVSRRFSEEKVSGKVANMVIDSLLPFRRTPANVVARAAEYSPAGLLKTAYDATVKLRKGETTGAQVIDELARNFTGTAALALGYALAAGFGNIRLRGSKVDEDEKRQGYQEYAIEVTGKDGRIYSYRIDWAAPANIPLFIGANLYDLMNPEDGESDLNVLTGFISAMQGTFEPMLALSMLSSINDLIESVQYADEDKLYTLFASTATSYLTQGIPALLRQTIKAAQETKQSTFTDETDPLMRGIQQDIGAMGLGLYQTDRVDAWGRKQVNDNWILRAVDSFANPGTYREIMKDPVEEEIRRLNGSQAESVSPPTAKKTLTYTDRGGVEHKNYRLTEQEYQTLATEQGQTQHAILAKMIETETYKAMTPQQKQSAFERVYDYAREYARTQAVEGYDGMDSWMKEITEAEDPDPVNAILDKTISGAFTDAFERMESNPQEAARDLEQAAKLLGDNDERRLNYGNEAGGRIKYFIDAQRSGVDAETFVTLYQQFREIDRKDISTSDKAQEWSYALEKAQDASTITGKQRNALKGSMQFRYSMPAETEKFDLMIEMGVKTDQADRVIQALGSVIGTGSRDKETGKKTVRNVDKWEKIAAMAGLSDREMDTIMKAYMPDYDPDAETPDKTEVKYEYAREELGISPEAYMKAYRAYVDREKGESAVALIQDTGLDYAAAQALENMFGGKKYYMNMVMDWYDRQ